jgi:hypothetical protein
VLNIVARFETYSFLDGYSGYHQIIIALEDKYKISFFIDWGVFIWKVMPFGMKNGPSTYHKVVAKAFKEYLDSCMKIFLDDFTMYNDMESHLQKLKLYPQKCKEYGTNLNPNKCAFMVFLSMILGFIVPKEGKLLDPKKI